MILPTWSIAFLSPVRELTVHIVVVVTPFQFASVSVSLEICGEAGTATSHFSIRCDHFLQ